MRLILTLLLATSTIVAFSQDKPNEKDLLAAFNTFFDANTKLDIDGMMAFIYPKLYEISPKEDLRAAMEKTLESDIMQFGFSNYKYISKTKIISVKKEKFCLLDYSYTLTIKFIVPDSTTEDYMSSYFEAMYGAENVMYDNSNHEIEANISSEAYGIYNNKKWYFIENSKDMEDLKAQLLPAEALDLDVD